MAFILQRVRLEPDIPKTGWAQYLFGLREREVVPHETGPGRGQVTDEYQQPQRRGRECGWDRVPVKYAPLEPGKKRLQPARRRFDGYGAGPATHRAGAPGGGLQLHLPAPGLVSVFSGRHIRLSVHLAPLLS